MNIKIIFLPIIILLFAACKKEKSKIESIAINDTLSLKNVKNPVDTTQTVSNTKKQDTVIQFTKQTPVKKEIKCQILKDYKILLPSDILFKSKNLHADFEKLSEINRNQINTSTQQALALGVVSADLVYASYFRNKNYVDKYYMNAAELSEKLGLQKIINKKGLEKIQNETNFNTIDTFIINKITYICNELSKESSATKLGFIIFGAWVESNYLLTDLIKYNPENSDSLYLQLYKQKNIAQSMIKYYNDILPDIADYNISLNMQTLIDELKNFQSLYEKVYSGDTYLIDKNNFEKLDSAFVTTRKNLFVNPQKKIEMSMKRPNR